MAPQAAAQAQAHKTTELVNAQESLALTRNLIRIAFFNIAYIRGLFAEDFFEDKDVPALGMKVKKLKPLDAESRRLIDWMEKGVYDALQKQYLRRLIFAIVDIEAGTKKENVFEEYSFHFSYGDHEVRMSVNKSGAIHASSEFSPDAMKKSACKMIRTLVQLMRTLNPVPDERFLVTRLLYYDERTPMDYEPPFFQKASDEARAASFAKVPLSMKVGQVDSRHHALAIHVRSVLDPCDAADNPGDEVDENHNMDLLHDGDNDKSDSAAIVVDQGAGNDGKSADEPAHLPTSSDTTDMTRDLEKENAAFEDICSWAHSMGGNILDIADLRAQFGSLSLSVINVALERMQQQNIIKPLTNGMFHIIKPLNHEVSSPAPKERPAPESSAPMEDLVYLKALQIVLKAKSVSSASLARQLKGQPGITSDQIHLILARMESEGYVTGESGKGRAKSRAVVKDQRANLKLQEVAEKLGQMELASAAAAVPVAAPAVTPAALPQKSMAAEDGGDLAPMALEHDAGTGDQGENKSPAPAVETMSNSAKANIASCGSLDSRPMLPTTKADRPATDVDGPAASDYSVANNRAVGKQPVASSHASGAGQKTTSGKQGGCGPIAVHATVPDSQETTEAQRRTRKMSSAAQPIHQTTAKRPCRGVGAAIPAPAVSEQ